jgi:hypothetical protein
VRWQGNKIPSTSALHRNNLVSHSMLPFSVNNLMIAHGFNQSNSSETIATRRTNCAMVMKSILRTKSSPMVEQDMDDRCSSG